VTLIVELDACEDEEGELVEADEDELFAATVW
jgi:hypothetical protein